MDQPGRVPAATEEPGHGVVLNTVSPQVASQATEALPWDGDALARLPEGPTDADPYWRLVLRSSWLTPTPRPRPTWAT
jgi:hypothetical protein